MTGAALTTASILAGWLFTVAGLIWTASKVAANNAAQLSQQAERIDDHEQRVRALERQTAEIAAMRQDVTWIKKKLERT